MTSPFLRDGRPRVYGHRGASAYAPMNTLAAFGLASAQGADGIELDVWLSKDGIPVVLHDATVDHTTDGTGFVWDMTLSELQRLNAGKRFNAYRGERVPTLNEVFVALGGVLLINVEIKSAGEAQVGMERAVADLIRRHQLERRVLVSSFDFEVLARFHNELADCALGYLFDAGDSAAFGVLPAQPGDAVHLHYSDAEAAQVNALKGRGLAVNVWTVNDGERAQMLAEAGVDGIITDMPDVILRALDR